MSVQWGRCNFDGEPIDPGLLERVRPVLAPYGPDVETRLCEQSIAIVFRGFWTTKESRAEIQPHRVGSGVVITWDGRLDNRADLLAALSIELSPGCSDVEIVGEAYKQWGTACFPKLVGDWAVSIWSQRDRTLTLAKDSVGVRPLFYLPRRDHIVWCSTLEPLVLLNESSIRLCEEYIAGWLSALPAPNLTPYCGIHAVPPASLVRLSQGKQFISRYWSFDSSKATRYATDSAYEEHFRAAFAESVRRRLRSDTPILAELSGGMDSSSVVCMADRLISQGEAKGPSLDTVSYYDDSEPNWDERPYFAVVEARRGRIGCHIPVAHDELGNLSFEPTHRSGTPGSPCRSRASAQLAEYMSSRGHRVLLSGVGGDEVAGGVPTPLPELEDLLASGRVRQLAHRLKIWALNKRKPWHYLLWETVRAFLPRDVAGAAEQFRPLPWLDQRFARRQRQALVGYARRVKLFGSLPSFQENLTALRGLQRQLACTTESHDPLYEKRYPFLDRTLLEFLYSLPPEQLVRPGQRRSVMRRALRGIVPDELLDRRRKAYAARALMVTVSANWTHLENISQGMIAASLGIVNEIAFAKILEEVRSGKDVPIVSVMRTIGLEFWLRHLDDFGLMHTRDAETGPITSAGNWRALSELPNRPAS